MAQRNLAMHGFESDLYHLDAAIPPFGAAIFDLIKSWGTIHQSERPERIMGEVWQGLKPGGRFIGMMYNRRSVAKAPRRLRQTQTADRPWHSVRDITRNHIESIGTKVYTITEPRALFSGFDAQSLVNHSNEHRIPEMIAQLPPDRWGFLATLRAVK